ncbi:MULTISPECIES: phasin [unclassified Bradyrhizobium]|uniref:Phasin n=1 Tax=Bradyrhizobium sp. LLZ17 TaxID=3239388 RepID=A0AB39XPY3_9BRAD
MPVSDANVNAETNAAPLNGTASTSEKLQFDTPFFGIHAIFGGFAEPAITRAKANFEQMKEASEAVTAGLCDACSASANRAAEYGTKVIEISNVNTSSALQFFCELANVKSFADLVNLSTAHTRKTIEASSAQNRELWHLAREVATETADPIKKSFNRVLHKAA